MNVLSIFNFVDGVGVENLFPEFLPAGQRWTHFILYYFQPLPMDLPAGVEPAVFYRQRLEGPCFLLFTALTIWLGGLQLAKLDADSAARRKTPGITKDEKKAIKAQAVRRKKCLVAAVLAANFLVLGYFKYWSYFAELLSGAFSATAPSSLGLVMPLGISFLHVFRPSVI